MQHRLSIRSLADLGSAAREFLSLVGDRKLVAFIASMGSGKTTFIKAVCEVLGVDEEEISSPTFSIINEYRTASGDTVYHFDFYRLTSDAQALDLGLYEYLDSGCLCLMEWPENISDLMPEDTLYVHIGVQEDGTRELTWQD